VLQVWFPFVPFITDNIVAVENCYSIYFLISPTAPVWVTASLKIKAEPAEHS
jgi:hypothetical protein